MPEALGGSRLASTDAVKLLKRDVIEQVKRSYHLHVPVMTMMRSRAKKRTTNRVAVECRFKVSPAMAAGARDMGQILPTEQPILGCSTDRIDQSVTVGEVFLALYYGGVSFDGPVADAARSGGSFGSMMAEKAQDAAEVMGWFEEMSILGDGTGKYAEVSSVDGTTITVKRPTGTVALAGQKGMYHFEQSQFDGLPVNFVNPADGTRVTNGGNAGFKVVDVSRTDGTLTLNRTVTGSSPTVAAGFYICEGNDGASSYNNVFIGIPGWIDDGTVRSSLLGLDRSRYRFLNSFAVDAQSGGALGEWNWTRDARILRGASFARNSRVAVVLMHPTMFDEPIFGSYIDNAATRQQPGLHSDRRFAAKGALNAGASAVTLQVPGFGEATYMGAWGVQANTKYYFDPADFEIVESKAGIEWLDGFSGPGGHYIRESDRDRYNASLRRRVAVYHTAPHKAGVERNVLMQTPDF